MQKNLSDFVLIEKEGGGGGQQYSQENLVKSCYPTEFVLDLTGFSQNFVFRILGKFGDTALSEFFSRHSLTQTASPSSTTYATPILALLLVAFRLLFGANFSVFRNLCKTKSQQIKRFIFPLRTKVVYLLNFVKDLLTIPPALPGRCRFGCLYHQKYKTGGLGGNRSRMITDIYWRFLRDIASGSPESCAHKQLLLKLLGKICNAGLQTKSKKNLLSRVGVELKNNVLNSRLCTFFLRPNSGMVMLLVVLVIPIAFLGIKYSQTLLDRRQKILEVSTEITPIYRKYDPATVALIAAKNWNPAKTVANQDLNPIYEAAFDSGIWRHKSTLGGAVPGLISDNSGEEMAAAVPPFAPTTSAGKIEYAKKDIKFFVDNDRIRAKIVGKSGFAVPAQCNLDLVLAIPTNANAVVTEIGKGCANFIKNNLYYTRGVYASVIPYSGKLSLPSDRYDGWTEAFPEFNKQSKITLYDLYATKGIQNTSLSEVYNDAGTNNGYSIMCRSSFFDATDARESKYKRMNLNPCSSITKEVFTDNICPVDCTKYVANPHAIMEPTADLPNVYAKCDKMTLPSDTKNTSSFIFAALEWANNMFQSWTTDPLNVAVLGNDSSIFASESKTTEGRKKAIVLVVNKPDIFADNEVTYLGLNNDADENQTSLKYKGCGLPESVSGTTWQSVCYGNGKFVAVPKDKDKGVYSTDGENWHEFSLPSSANWVSVCYGNGKFIALICGSNKAARSSNGINWEEFTMPLSLNWRSICFGKNKFVAVADSDKTACSSDGTSWSTHDMPSSANWISVCYGDNRFVTIGSGSNKVAYSDDGATWTAGEASSGGWCSMCYGDGTFLVVAPKANGIRSTDGGLSWVGAGGMPSWSAWSSVAYGEGHFISSTSTMYKMAVSDNMGAGWWQSYAACAATTICYGDGKFISMGGQVNHISYPVSTSTIGNKFLKSTLGNGNAAGVTTLTTNACTKLKQAYGDSVRIYIVKYRKTSEADNNYTYLDNCATSTGGKAYDINDSATLKSTLDEIAADLKSWAGYQEAGVVN